MSNEPGIVIMAAGASSRMRESLDSTDPGMKEAARILSGLPKTMIPVGPDGRPFLDYLLLNVARAGYSDAVIVVQATGNSIRVRYEDFADVVALPPGLRVSFAVQEIPEGRQKPAGTADALYCALSSRPDWEGQKFTVCNGDNLYTVPSLRAVLESGHENSIAAFDSEALGIPRAKLETFAVIKTDVDGRVLDIIEKPGPAAFESAADGAGRINVSMNVMRFSYDMIYPILGEVPFDPVRGEKELPAAIRMMIARHPGSLRAIPLSESVPDLTSSGDISAVIGYIRRNYPAFG
jgi:glucose-1-phosphate adenylyltransferase